MTHLIDDFCCGSCCVIATAYVVFQMRTPKVVIVEVKELPEGDEDSKVPSPKKPEKEHAKDIKDYLLRLIETYQNEISPQIKKDLGITHICKFYPSCSEFGRQSIEKYGIIRGSIDTFERLLRCNPLSKGGYDPVL